MSSPVHAFRRDTRKMICARARDDLFVFYRLMFSVLNPETDFIDAPHFEIIIRALERVVSGRNPRLLVAVPPRHGKSRLISVLLPAWLLGRDPTLKIICGSYGDDLSRDFARRTRALMSHPKYREIFPETLLAVGGQGLNELRTSAGGFRLATSVQGTVTGKGADYVIIDDPIKAVDANSELVRTNAYEWMKTSIMSRFDAPSEARAIVTHQRLHQDDLIGRLKSEGGWHNLTLPGIAPFRHVFHLSRGKWIWNAGDPLFPQRFGLAALNQQRIDLGERDFYAQILQRPVPAGGLLFEIKNFQRYDYPPNLEMIVQSWDPALTDSDTAAYSVCTTWGVAGRKVYLLDVFRKRLKFHQLEAIVLKLRADYNANFVIIEASGLGKALCAGLLRQPGVGPWLMWDEPKLGKIERAIAQTPKIERKRVYLPNNTPWLEAFEAELVSFPMSKYKDQVDSMVQFLGSFDFRTKMTVKLASYADWPKQLL